MMQALKEDVLTNKYIWLFAIAYFFVYVVRQGVTSWFVFYLKVRSPRSSGMSCPCDHIADGPSRSKPAVGARWPYVVLWLVMSAPSTQPSRQVST